MLAKLTSKNQLTLPKAAVEATGNAEYFEVEARAGQLVLTPVRIQRADAVRAKLAKLNLDDDGLAAAVSWARQANPASHAAHIAEPRGRYDAKPSRASTPVPRRKR
ncbi:hypothetical protein [Rhodanobacter sp. UC4436_H3]|jgi:hypothetical protein|nr:MAG: AbrB family transcriptional regulator [Rhodanobacter sp. 67-28]